MALSIEALANGFRHRLEDGKDVVVAVTGDEGDGKTTLGYHICLATDSTFHLERNILYSPNYEEMKNKVKSLPRYSAILADEAIKALYKLRWQDKMQQYINILYGICRDENKLSVLCMPRFTDFNEFFRQHRIRFWIWIVDPISKSTNTGHAIVLSRSWNPFTSDAWNYKEMDKIIVQYAHDKRLRESEFNLNHKIHIISRSRNYVGMIEFSKMPDDEFGRYLELKRQFAYEGMEKSDTPIEGKREAKQREQIKILCKLAIEKGIETKDIAEKLNVTRERLYQLMAK